MNYGRYDTFVANTVFICLFAINFLVLYIKLITNLMKKLQYCSHLISMYFFIVIFTVHLYFDYKLQTRSKVLRKLKILVGNEKFEKKHVLSNRH